MAAEILGRRAALAGAVAAVAAPGATRPDAALLADCAAWLALDERREAVVSPFYSQVRWPAEVYAEESALSGQARAIMEGIPDAPATSLAGLRAKARVLVQLLDPAGEGLAAQPSVEERLALSLANDILSFGLG
jgi:hypothetical protein